VILDSSFLIDIEGQREAALRKAQDIETTGAPRRVPLIVVFELYISVGKGTRTDENRQTVDRVLHSLPIVGLTEPIAKRAGIIEGELQAEDRGDEGIGPADAIIAATALEYEEPIVTDDPDDFERVDGVTIETY
jgi:tRNA(fMet)-specific endonuclease VapC